MSVTAILPAAGVGKRFGGSVKKQFYELNGKPVLYYTLKRLAAAYPFDEFILGLGEGDFDVARSLAAEAGIENIRFVPGGAERFHTVLNCVKEAKTEWVLVHDAVRPFVPDAVIQETVQAAMQCDGAICGLYARDTIKRVRDGGIVETIPRDEIFLAHTPQVFRKISLCEALENCAISGFMPTDEAQAMERAKYSVRVVQSTVDNIKITYIDDIEHIRMLAVKYFVT